MKKIKSTYHFFNNKAFFFLLFVFIRSIAFCQKVDTSSGSVADTVVSNPDSAYGDEYSEENQDSVKKAKYNFYINRNAWENDTLELRQVPATTINSLKAKDEFWYADKEFRKEKSREAAPGGDFFEWPGRQQWYRILAWIIIIGGFLAVLIWFLASSNVGLFRRKSKLIAGATEEEAAENIFEINYQKEIDNAVQRGDYRLATRLLFLHLLKNLAEKNIIQYKQERTNFDYLLQLNSTGYYKDFFRLTRNYEYAWYGEFEVNRDIFTIIKNDFDNFNNRL